MAKIELIDVSHSYSARAGLDADYALKSTTLTWANGSASALLGPSGCGKTTLLNIISGLLRPTHGRVLFDGKDVTGLAPQQRNIAQVFEFPVVYDTMSVYDNLAFPLRNRGVPEPEIRKRVHDVAEMLGLDGTLKKPAAGLSADAKQKLSLGRGLVRQDVAAILLDEPLTVIDPQVKWLLRRKLKQIHERLGLTMIYVTHDQHEALTFADQVAVMRDGEIVQQGRPEELHEHPADAFVGYFIGSPGMNLMPVELVAEGAIVAGHTVDLGPETTAKARGAKGSLQLGIRPEFITLTDPDRAGALPVTVRAVEHLGSRKIAVADLGELVLKVKVGGEVPVEAGQTLGLHFPPERLKIYADGKAVN